MAFKLPYLRPSWSVSAMDEGSRATKTARPRTNRASCDLARDLGPAIYEAAKEGSVVDLRAALSCERAKDHIDYQDKATQMTPLMVAAVHGHLLCVKLLLAHSADIHASIPGPRFRSSRQTAASLAAKHSHKEVSQYLQGCIDDLVSRACTRAHMEADMISIAENSKCSYRDAAKFCSLLQQLLDDCGYSLTQEEDEEPSLLLRAAKVNNSLIVHKLVKEFEVNPVFSTDPETAKNVLHFACHNMSQLRFYFASQHKDLLCMPDRLGDSPLHIACANNDVEFVTWLFRGMLDVKKEEGAGGGTQRNGVKVPPFPMRTMPRQLSLFPYCYIGEVSLGTHLIGPPERPRAASHAPLHVETAGTIMMPSPDRAITEESDAEEGQNDVNSTAVDGTNTYTNGLLDELDDVPNDTLTASTSSNYIPTESDFLPVYYSTSEPIPASFIPDIKLFRKNMDGKSILHILAYQGHSQLLGTVLKVAERLKHVLEDDELSVLTQRDGFTLRTPIEEGLMVGNVDCVRLLIEFAENTRLMKRLFEDEDLLKVAVLFDQGGPARNVEALKMLIEFGFNSGLAKSITLADLKEHSDVTRLLLFYQTQIVNSLEYATVHRNHTVSLKAGHIKWEGFNLRHIEGEWLRDANGAVDSVSRILNDPPDCKIGTQNFFRKLGASCLRYFENLNIPTTLERLYIIPIVEMNLAENHLTTVPPAIFQQPHLRTLKLSHNELQELPVSGSVHETLYSCHRLHKLELDWNQLRTLPEELCRGVGRSLEELNLVHNHLTELPPGLWVMRRLKKLKLNQNKLTRLHLFSGPRYFTDPLLTQRVVMLFEATSDGVLKTAEGSDVERDQEVLGKVQSYLTHLMSFLKTVLVMLDKDDPTANLARAVIDIHWRRYSGCEDGVCIAHSASASLIDTCFELAEDENGTSLIQTGFSALQELHLDENCFKEIPWDLPCIAPNLSKLFLTENKITDVDIVHGPPSEIKTLCLSKNRIVNTLKMRSTSLPCASPLFLLSTQPERASCFTYCTHCQRTHLNHLAKLTLDHNLLTKFDLIDVSKNTHEEELSQNLQAFTSIDIELLFPNITVLNLSHNQLKYVPRNIEKLTSLSSLYLSGNTAITELPEELGVMNPQVFLTLFLDGVFIKNIPQSILNTSTRNIICYFKSIREKSQAYRRIKLMVVGEDNKGKTSLLLNLTRQGSMVRFREVALDHRHQPLATNGVELGDWEYAPRGRQKVTFMTWDFGGQEEYYATHQCFLTNRSLFLLVWNVMDGEAGLLSLRPWLENIEARAKDSPVIVVATHADGLPHSNYKNCVAQLQSRLKELYSHGEDSFAYPKNCTPMHVVNCRDNKHMDQLRTIIYNTAVQYCPPPPRRFKTIRPPDIEPLLEQKVPESYVKLHDKVRQLAHACTQQNRVPIFTRQEYLCKVRELGEIQASNDELDQATSFLHSNGILLHYDDSQLSDLYFVDPQWLCSMLATVITVRERNPHVKDGIISKFNLNQLLRGTKSSTAEVISLMQKFEVMLQLDSERLLIPSLLPDNEATPFIVMPLSTSHRDDTTHQSVTDLRLEPPAPITSLPDLLVRYMLLPYIPNGFFPRLIARVLSSDVATQVQASLSRGPLDDVYLLNCVHWESWRSGISLVWNHLEILRIAPLRFPLPNSRGATLISSLRENREREMLKGVEIMVAVLPEEQMLSCPVLPPSRHDSSCKMSRCMSTWLLQRAIELADSVMEDWYEVFGFRRGLENFLNCVATPCPECFKSCHNLQGRHASHSPDSTTNEPDTQLPKPLFMFSIPFCCLQLRSEGRVTCPTHGGLDVAQVAPDVVFADFAPSALIPNKAVKILQRLGEGGFGTVSLGFLNTGSEPVKVAVKEVQCSQAQAAMICRVPELEQETRSWLLYRGGSVEARMMYQLDHPNILTLLGITLYPIRLVLELAKEDLCSTVARYKKKNKRFNRRTLRATLTQIADAMAYLHSKDILFRDLKPGNVLVWQFPLPSEQWNPEASVLLKLADYGISRRISPQGIHSKDGTPLYLPPEVLLHSEREAASLKVDVYSFGMVMYYLFALKNPFDNSALIASQLRGGRRPELPTKHWPHSIQMVELMTWCWSEKPTHRPSFDQILSILHSDTTYSLVGGIPVSRDAEVHAACVRTVSVQLRRHSLAASPSSGAVTGPRQCCLRMAGIIPPRACGIGMETGVEVWYGTVTGKLNVVRYLSSGVTVEPVQHSSGSYISSIVTAGGNVWVASVGSGLWVYDTTARQQLAVWGETERRNIFQLVVLKDTVLALTHSGMYIFTAKLSDSSQTVQVLVPTHHCPHSRLENSVGVYVPPSENLPCGEVWTCAQNSRWLQVLSPENLSMKLEVEIPAGQSRKIRHLETIAVRDKCYVFLSDRHILHKWEVWSRRHAGALDCHAACWTDAESPVPLKQGRVTSLTAGDDGILYVGNGAGIILLVNADTLEVTSHLSAYNTPVRCLFPIKMTPAFSRMISSMDSTTSIHTNSASTSSMATVTSCSSPSSDSTMSSPVPESPSASDERSVLMSFGIGYKGIVGSHLNHPGSFLLPGSLRPCPCCTHFLLQAQPTPSTGYMLLWSRDSGPRCGPSEDVDGQNFDGSSE